MKTTNLFKLLILAFAMSFSFNSFAQYEDDDYSTDDYSSDYSSDYDDGYGDEENPDSTLDDSSDSYDDYDDAGASDYGFGSGSQGSGNYVVKPKIEVKPYVRFIPPYDSIRELVSYNGVVKVLDRDDFEVEVDTIYARAKGWMEMEFGSKELKKMTTLDDINPNASEMEYKIKLKGSFPCMVEPNDFTARQDGDVEFLMEIRIREGRYRYMVNNLVYVAPTLAGEKERDRTYFEYMMKAEDFVKGGDVYLLAADKKITSMMDDLKKQCQKMPIEEEDEW